ncbi:MAG TPA: hypothetical protein V6D08_07245 [Candidatus Obscuribacterales bacterium]
MSSLKKVAFVLAFGLPFIFHATAPAYGQEIKQPKVLYGRVEEIAGGGEPRLPQELLRGGTGQDTWRLGVDQAASLPPALKGEWDGSVKITQMDTYPDLHREPYCLRFIEEIKNSFRLGKTGRLTLKFQLGPDGKLRVASSDVWFAHGLRVQLTTHVSPALVPGGTNLPTTVKNDVQELGADRVEQVRIDQVRIVDGWRRAIHYGFTEVSAVYQIVAPKRMRIKILNVDYDQSGKPLWKTLMEGEARRWSSG